MRQCPVCGGSFDVANNVMLHTETCPMGEKPALVSKPVASLDARRFHQADHPAHLNPRMALVAALDWYDNLPVEDRPDHIQVLTGKNVGTEGCSGTKFFQAGSYRHHGQMGLCLEAMHMIRESGRD